MLKSCYIQELEHSPFRGVCQYIQLGYEPLSVQSSIVEFEWCGKIVDVRDTPAIGGGDSDCEAKLPLYLGFILHSLSFV